jgi:hypothetical protein
MTGYLGRLVDRAVGRAAVLEPRLRSRFDPGRIGPAAAPERPWDREVEIGGDPGRPATPAAFARAPAAGGTPLTHSGDAERRPRPAESAAPRDGPRPPSDALATSPLPGARWPDPRDGAEPAEAVHARLRGAADLAERLLAEVRRERMGARRDSPDAALRPPAPASPPPIALEPRRSAEPPSPPRPDHPLAPRRPTAPPPLRVAERAGARSAAASPTPAPEAPAAVHVTIGSVEVRAAISAAPPAPAPRRAEGRLALEEYLRRRDGGGA